MVKKAAAVKSKKVEPSVEEKIEMLASEEPKKESSPQVMQVVEVTDEPVETGIPKTEPTKVETESEVTHTEVFNDEVPQMPEKTQEEKQQEVVSEFFAKKEKPSSFGYPNISVHKKSSLPGVFLWAIGVIGIVVGIGFLIISMSRGSIKMPTIAVKPTPTSVPIPTAVPTPVIDRKSLKIQILNGSGTAGVAGTLKALLEEKGYTVAGTGNAKTYDYKSMEIQVTSDKESFIAVLQSDLSGKYTIGSTSATLKSTLPYDAVVIIGKE